MVKVKVVVMIKNKKKTNLGTPRILLFWFNMLQTLLPGSQCTVGQKHINCHINPLWLLLS